MQIIKETQASEIDENEIRNLTNELRRYLTNSYEDKSELNYIKRINSLILFSGVLIQIHNYTEAIRQISKILQKMEEKINLNIDKNDTYNFSMFIFNSLVSEKILYLLSLIADKSELKRTKIIIYINLLDLSPIFNVKLRSFILGDLYKFCFDSYKRFIGRKTIKEIPNIKENKLLCHMILARHKIRSLYFSSNKNVIKNVVLLFDLNFPILRDKHFLINFKKLFKKKNHKNYFYIAFFEEYLFIFKNFYKYEMDKAKEEENEYFNLNHLEYENRNSYTNINSTLQKKKLVEENFNIEKENDSFNKNTFNEQNNKDFNNKITHLANDHIRSMNPPIKKSFFEGFGNDEFIRKHEDPIKNADIIQSENENEDVRITENKSFEKDQKIHLNNINIIDDENGIFKILKNFFLLKQIF